MASTRFHNDPYRVQKQTEDSSYTGKYFLSTPAVQENSFYNLPYIEDSHIRLQSWGANMMTNSLDIENELLGITRKLNRDAPSETYQNGSPQMSSGLFSPSVVYPSSGALTTDETRASNPAWLLRGIEIPRWENPILNPQASVGRQAVNELIAPPPRLNEMGHIEFPENGINIQTRIMEKDNYRPDYQTPEPAEIPFIPKAYPFM